MNRFPQFDVYGNYASGNYGAHALVFTDAQGRRFWFSYKTLVAFDDHDGRPCVIQNHWGPTTGKHLNAIDRGNRKNRLSDAAFKAKFQEVYGRPINEAA